VLDALAYIGYVLMALMGFGFVIAIHEFGHFIFAKWAGVRVDVFSIGFGPVVLKRRVGETDYVLSLLPLGGYVKMLGQEDVPSGTDAPAQPDPRSYLAKSAGWKALILLGGVLFNLVSSYIILLALVAWGMPVFHPIVGDVQAKIIDQTGLPVVSPAARLGLQRGDRLIEVDGEHVRSFDDVMTAVIFSGAEPLTVVIDRAGQRLTLPAAGAAPVQPVFEGRLGRPSLGIDFPASNRLVLAEGPGDGVHRLDRVLTIDGEDVSGLIGQDIQDRFMRHFGKPVAVTVERDGERRELTVTYAGGPDGAFDVRAGVPVRFASVDPSGPAAAAGLRAGDWVLAVDGKPVSGSTHFLALVRAALDTTGSCLVAVQRDGKRIEATVAGARIFGVQRLGVGVDAVDGGVLAVLPPALEGGPGLLERTGLKPGDALIAWKPGQDDVRIGWISGGEARTLSLGLDEAGWQSANRYREPGLLRKILGAKPERGLAQLLAGTRVLAVHETAIELAPAGETPQPPRTLARSQFGAAADGLAVGDWITDARLGPDGAIIEVVRGAAEPRWATLAAPPLGTALFFDREELPYKPTSTGDAFGLVNDAAYNLVVKSVTLIPRLFRSPEAGGVDPNKSLTGPIGIFRELKTRAELMGFASFLKLVALVGLNLFIVNLLPIPITDGGQLVMLGVETAIRRPLPMWLRNGLMYAGISVVGLLFVYICGLDILRLFGIT
jgi:membrane-associated protease RseP (regulator of RpoE activity)